MNFIINRDDLVPALQAISGVVDRRQTLPILSNFLFHLSNETLSITATDMEVELITQIQVQSGESGEITVPARKFFDICRALPAGSSINFEVNNDKVLVKSGKSRFTLSTMPAEEYPSVDINDSLGSFSLNKAELKRLLENTQFAMAQQDVRYYLNGLLLELDKQRVNVVATDGHRLAMDLIDTTVTTDEASQIIVPRKGIQELIRLLDGSEDSIRVDISKNHIRIELDSIRFTSKLIDGKFPDYKKVIPQVGSQLTADREALKQTLTRASILSNEKYRGVRIVVKNNLLVALAHNPEQEEAEEEIGVDYQGPEIEIGFNVSYLLDTLTVLKSEKVVMSFIDANSSTLIHSDDESQTNQYVVMPMRL